MPEPEFIVKRASERILDIIDVILQQFHRSENLAAIQSELTD